MRLKTNMMMMTDPKACTARLEEKALTRYPAPIWSRPKRKPATREPRMIAGQLRLPLGSAVKRNMKRIQPAIVEATIAARIMNTSWPLIDPRWVTPAIHSAANEPNCEVAIVRPRVMSSPKKVSASSSFDQKNPRLSLTMSKSGSHSARTPRRRLPIHPVPAHNAVIIVTASVQPEPVVASEVSMISDTERSPPPGARVCSIAFLTASSRSGRVWVSRRERMEKARAMTGIMDRTVK